MTDNFANYLTEAVFTGFQTLVRRSCAYRDAKKPSERKSEFGVCDKPEKTSFVINKLVEKSNHKHVISVEDVPTCNKGQSVEDALL